MILLSMARKTQTLQVDPSAGNVVTKLAGDYRMKKKDVVARTFTWLMAQNDVVRAEVLGVLPDSLRSDIARLTLENMAKSAGQRRIKETQADQDSKASPAKTSRHGSKT